jgi:hypothetical protein
MNVTSTLEAVTIYREGAVCTRRCRLDATPPGAVRVVGLPLTLVPGSVRARILSGPPGLRVLDVRPGFDATFGDAINESAEVKARDTARPEVQRLEAAFQRLDAEVRELQELKPKRHTPEEGAPPRPAPVEAALALAGFVDERLRALLAEKRSVEKHLKDAREALQLSERRLAEASAERRTQHAKVTRAIIVTLSTPDTAGPIELEVEYQVPGVRWVPNYTLRLSRGFSSGELRLRASVAQDTGEDWSGVALSLSTARLLRRTDVPELKSLRVGRSQPAPPRAGFRAPPPGLEALFEGFDVAQRRPPVVAAPVPKPQAPPPPPPPPRARRSLVEKDPAEVDEPAPESAEDAMPMERSASVPRAFAKLAPGAPPPPSAAPARRSMARPMAARGGGIGTSLGGVLESAAAPADFEDEGGDFGAEEPTGSGLARAPQAPPPFSVAEELLDYGRLVMPGPDQGSARGRLTPSGPWASVFAVGVSVQVDVVMVLVEQFQARASAVERLTPPPGCVPVASLDQFDFRYACAARVDVPSTGRWSTLPVMECQVGLAPNYVCVPAVEPKVYRTLAIRNDTPQALLAGPVDVSVGDEFLMTTAMPAVPPGANTERLGLGVEEAVKVSRKTSFAETAGGFLGGSTVLRHDVEIELNNRLSTPAPVEVRERLPLPAPHEKDVKVEEVKIEPLWDAVEGPLDGVVTHGLKRWRVVVPPGQRLRLTAQYAIRIPADKMLVGGNRRD